MLTFASPSVAPSVTAWIESASTSLSALFSHRADLKTSRRQVTRASAVEAPGSGVHGSNMASTVAESPVIANRADRRPCDQVSSTKRSASAAGATYWPCERLNAFILQMAAHGHCVSVAMMLGHRPYAVEQLSAAAQVGDESLRSLAAELQAYFDAPAEDAVKSLIAI